MILGGLHSLSPGGGQNPEWCEKDRFCHLNSLQKASSHAGFAQLDSCRELTLCNYGMSVRTQSERPLHGQIQASRSGGTCPPLPPEPAYDNYRILAPGQGTEQGQVFATLRRHGGDQSAPFPPSPLYLTRAAPIGRKPTRLGRGHLPMENRPISERKRAAEGRAEAQVVING